MSTVKNIFSSLFFVSFFFCVSANDSHSRVLTLNIINYSGDTITQRQFYKQIENAVFGLESICKLENLRRREAGKITCVNLENCPELSKDPRITLEYSGPRF